jgi:ABC-type lipoprotein export system ATPase subunit
MPKFTHSVSSDYKPSFRADAVASMFDVPPTQKLTRTWEVDMPFDDLDWQIGLIYGPSGSGKTTIARTLFGDAYHTGYQWGDGSILDDFPKSATVKDITKAVSSVGFSSPPDWLKRYAVLSNGQQFRAEVARLLLDDENYPDVIALDEFTSLVDRTVAKASCAAVQRYIRAGKKKFVAVTCHSDIVDWLNPDWTYEVSSGEFTDLTGRSERRVKHLPIEITIRRVTRQAWYRSGVGNYHYLDNNVIRSVHLYAMLWGETLVGMCAVKKFPHAQVSNGWSSSRTVVLPDFQGLRIGVAANDRIAQYYCEELGCRFFGRSTHPAMNAHRRRSSDWMLFTQAGTVGKPSAKGKITGQSIGRCCESFEYVGHVRPKEVAA